MTEPIEREILVFDTEANGLLHNVTKMWCIVLANVITKCIEVYHDYPQYNGVKVFDKFDGKTHTIPVRNGTLKQGAERLNKAGRTGGKLIAHNVLGYDDELLRKFYPEFYDVPLENYHDTLIQSKLQWFERRQPKGAKGTHGLQAWAVRAGLHKPDVGDWTTMDAFKLHRCIEDVLVNLWTYETLERERVNLEERCGVNLEEAMKIEHEYRYNKTIQELNGAYVDVPHMEACIKDLDEKCEVLRVEIEPQLPMTVKAKAVKCGRNELMTLLGHPRPQPDKIIWKEVDGQAKRVVVKEYYRPSVNFHKVIKGKTYQAINDSGLESPHSFMKLKGARDWAKTQEVPKKSKWKYPATPSEYKVLNKNTCGWFDVEEDATDVIVGAFTRVTFHKSTLSQSAVVKKFLISLGWQPTEWNLRKDSDGQFLRALKDTTVYFPEKAPRENQIAIHIKAKEALVSSPKLTEDSYDSLPEGIGLKIAHFNTYAHRRTFIANPNDMSKGLLRKVREDGRLPCGVNCFGTATGRA